MLAHGLAAVLNALSPLSLSFPLRQHASVDALCLPKWAQVTVRQSWEQNETHVPSHYALSLSLLLARQPLCSNWINWPKSHSLAPLVLLSAVCSVLGATSVRTGFCSSSQVAPVVARITKCSKDGHTHAHSHTQAFTSSPIVDFWEILVEFA